MRIFHLHYTRLTPHSALLMLTFLALLVAAGVATPDKSTILSAAAADTSTSVSALPPGAFNLAGSFNPYTFLPATMEYTPTVTSSVATGNLLPVAMADPTVAADNQVYLPLLLYGAATTMTEQPLRTSEHAVFVARVVDETNKYRRQHGCPALTVNAQLASAAQRHTDDMARNSFLSHTGSDGSSPWERIKDARYVYTGAAENIAAGQRTPQEVVRAWYNSAGHRANILNCSYQEVGVGYTYDADARYGYYWTEVFGRR
jgi:uncharacterized protein YkwD